MKTPGPYEAIVLADSIASGTRLTTLCATFPRIVLAEFNTHRVFCLAGDAELEFDLPSGQSRGGRRVYKMRLDTLVDRWLNGADRKGANPKREVDLSWLEDDTFYAAPTVAARFGLASASGINKMCRDGLLGPRVEKRGLVWHIRGEEIKAWREARPAHTRFGIRERLRAMRIRQLNELTGDVQWSHVKDVQLSGEQDVYELRAGDDFSVAGSLNHRILTDCGWKKLGDIKPGEFVVVRKFGKRDDDRLDPLRLKKIDGRWRSVWQRDQRERLQRIDPKCRRCRHEGGVHIHHLVPVYEDPSRAFDETNITLLCDVCHNEEHRTQGWQGGTYLYGTLSEVTEVVYRGVEKTYDLEIAGAFPNFLANGVVVHNSRNSASSRAIPVAKRIEQVRENPYVPLSFGKNTRGMQAKNAEIESVDAADLRWRRACADACEHAERLAEYGLHKQWANRLIEPFAWHTVIVTATEWANFFALRISEYAQPEIRKVAEAMKAAMDASTPQLRLPGNWHLPLVDWNESALREAHEVYARTGNVGPAVKLSVARCAAVSYDRHMEQNIERELERYELLVSHGHMSPTEHPAVVGEEWEPPVGDAFLNGETTEHDGERFDGPFIGNFRAPWIQHRKLIPGEAVFGNAST